MKIAVVGTGYVGLVTGACFSDVGIDVYCIDIDEKKIENLKNGILPIYEPGLEEMVERNRKKGRLTFSVSLKEVVDECEVIFIAVGTPPDEDGSADLQYVLAVAAEIGKAISHYHVVVTKSTVPVGTADKVRRRIQEELDKRGAAVEFDVASNPEFLKEGAAIDDFMKPDRIVIGIGSKRAEEIMYRLYKPFVLNAHPIVFMDIPSAEMTKYAANAMLACRISFMNEIANLCEIVGADINLVRKGIGSDPRIGSKFLYSGIGYGGSCFPKDVQALIRTAREKGIDLRILQAVEKVNRTQKLLLFEKVNRRFQGDLTGRTVAMWGLSFKPQTDDMREAPSLVLIERFLQAGCRLRVYDPVAMEETRRKIGDKVEYCRDPYHTLDGADCLLLVTEWTEFRFPDFQEIKKRLKQPLIFDGRNIFDRDELYEYGFEYFGIGRTPAGGCDR